MNVRSNTHITFLLFFCVALRFREISYGDVITSYGTYYGSSSLVRGPSTPDSERTLLVHIILYLQISTYTEGSKLL